MTKNNHDNKNNKDYKAVEDNISKDMFISFIIDD